MPKFCAFVLLLAAVPLTNAAPLALSPCRLEHPARIASVVAECGRLSVLENAAQANGRRIELFVARLPAVSLRKKPDPLFLIAGGPGQGTVDLYMGTAAGFARVRRDRDIVLLDQRGTGKSARLSCDFGDDDLVEVSDEQAAELTRQCRDKLAQQADLRQYTTSIAVGDLEAVRAALGYAQINVYGVSYGTRVAQHYARRYPDRLRSVILDGVVHPEFILGPAMALDAERSLTNILARCATDAACQKAFGDPQVDYRALRELLEKAPVSVTVNESGRSKPTTFELGPKHLSAVLRFASYDDSQAALLPLTLKLANRDRNFTPLANQFLIYARSLGDSFAYGMHNSVACSEDVPLIDSTKLDRAQLNATHMTASQVDQLVRMCRDWPRGMVDADFHAPLKSKVAALLLSGVDDPVTPPAYAAIAQRGFADNAHLIVPARGHGQINAPCMDRVVEQFITDGSARGLDIACTKKLRPMPFFTSVAGPAP